MNHDDVFTLSGGSGGSWNGLVAQAEARCGDIYGFGCNLRNTAGPGMTQGRWPIEWG